MTPEEFKAWRGRMGWTQQQAADELGLSKRQLIRIEQGVGSRGNELEISRTVYLATVALESSNLKITS